MLYIVQADFFVTAGRADMVTQMKSDYLMEAGMRNLPRGICKKDYKGSGYEQYINKEIFCVGLVSGEVDTCLVSHTVNLSNMGI